MFNKQTVARINLTARTFGATDQAGEIHPDMVGVMYVSGGVHKDVTGTYEVNEVTGKKCLNLFVADNGDGVSFVGKLLRDESVQDRAQYVGFLRQRVPSKLENMTVDLLSEWQLEISVESTLLSYGIPGVSGNVFPPSEAARYSVNRKLREQKVAF